LRIVARLGGVLGTLDPFLPALPGAASASYAIPVTGTMLRPGGGAWTKNEINAATCYVVNGVTLTANIANLSFLAWDVTYNAITSVGANQSGNYIDRAYLTARAGWARADASRTAFVPTDTQGTTATAGLSPGSPGGYYCWRRRYLPDTVWTPLLPIASER
jgi:hypothetical protein